MSGFFLIGTDESHVQTNMFLLKGEDKTKMFEKATDLDRRHPPLLFYLGMRMALDLLPGVPADTIRGMIRVLRIATRRGAYPMTGLA
jgi:hypothetical protein